MAINLAVTPAPVAGATVSVTATGLPTGKLLYYLRNGVEIARGRPTKAGTFGPFGCIVTTTNPMVLSIKQTKTTIHSQSFPLAVTPPVEPPPVEPPPVEPPPATKSVRVTTIPSLLTTLADDTVDEIVVANGTYRVNPSSSQAANSLWIGSKFAGRTRPITVRAETKGGVIIDGGGGPLGGISFEDGAHHQTWDGFSFANGRPYETGVIMFGGYNLAPAHHITLRNITILPSVFSDWATNQDHCIYFSNGANHDILIEDYTATPTAVSSALQFHHPTNAYNVTVRRMHTVGMQNIIAIYESSVHDVLIEDSDIKDAKYAALNVGSCGANVVIKNVTSTQGYYFPSGKPAGLTMVGCTWG